MIESHNPSKSRLPRHVSDAFQEQFDRLHNRLAAERLWQRVLTEEERRRCGESFEAAFKIHPGAELMLGKARDLPPDLAILDAGKALDFLSPANWRQLQAALFEVNPKAMDYRAGEPLMIPDAPDWAMQQFEEARHRKQLAVLVCEGGQSVCWRRLAMPIEWNRHLKLWRLFYALAKASARGGCVDRHTVHAEKSKTLTHQVSRLRQLIRQTNVDEKLKEELANTIEWMGQGQYRLDLRKNQVEVLETEAAAARLDID